MLFHGVVNETISIEHANAAYAYYSERDTTLTLGAFTKVGHAYPIQMKHRFETIVAGLLKQERE